jgi:hypothetical protein
MELAIIKLRAISAVVDMKREIAENREKRNS